MKNILVDIGHPAHVHLFKNFISIMQQKSHNVIVTVKDIPAAKRLLKCEGIKYIDLGNKFDSIHGKFIKQIQYNWLLYQIVKKNQIDFGLGSSATIAHVSKFTRMKSFIFDDDDSAVEPLFAYFAHPFADYVISPDCLNFERNSKKSITYAGYHELAYLHPRRFTPDKNVLKDLNLSEDTTFFVMRFNVFKAHHDIGVKGLSIEQKRMIISILEKAGRVFITTERDIEPEFKKYQLQISPEKIHSLLYYATLFVGDSQTMTSEAAVLGTPAIRCNSFVGKISYLEEQNQKYELNYGYLHNQWDELLAKINSLLNTINLKHIWEKRRQKMLSEKIDVTAFMVWFVEHYPESVRIMKESPDYQYRFR